MKALTSDRHGQRLLTGRNVSAGGQTIAEILEIIGGSRPAPRNVIIASDGIEYGPSTWYGLLGIPAALLGSPSAAAQAEIETQVFNRRLEYYRRQLLGGKPERLEE